MCVPNDFIPASSSHFRICVMLGVRRVSPVGFCVWLKLKNSKPPIATDARYWKTSGKPPGSGTSGPMSAGFSGKVGPQVAR